MPLHARAADADLPDPLAVNEAKWAPAQTDADLDGNQLKIKKAEEAKTKAAHAGDTKASGPAVAQPIRPINVPVMPGIVNHYMVQVDSTAEALAESDKAAVVTNKAGEPDLALQELNWRDAAELAREQADQKQANNSEGERTPLEVRLSYLPNPKIVPQEAAQRPLRARYTEMPSSVKNVTPEPAAKNPMECGVAAIDTYKKKQLEAIQSDRKTLEALQSAIADLGLQKQLNFMSGASQQSTSAAGVAGPATVIQ